MRYARTESEATWRTSVRARRAAGECRATRCRVTASSRPRSRYSTRRDRRRSRCRRLPGSSASGPCRCTGTSRTRTTSSTRSPNGYSARCRSPTETPTIGKVASSASSARCGKRLSPIPRCRGSLPNEGSRSRLSLSNSRWYTPFCGPPASPTSGPSERSTRCSPTCSASLPGSCRELTNNPPAPTRPLGTMRSITSIPPPIRPSTPLGNNSPQRPRPTNSSTGWSSSPDPSIHPADPPQATRRARKRLPDLGADHGINVASALWRVCPPGVADPPRWPPGALGAPEDLDGLRTYLDRIHVRQRLRPIRRTADGSAADLGGRSAFPLASTAHKTARRESGTVSGMCRFWPVEPRLSITTNALLLELILGCLRHPLVPSADRSSERIPREGISQADRLAALGYLKMGNPPRGNSAHGPTAEALSCR